MSHEILTLGCLRANGGGKSYEAYELAIKRFLNSFDNVASSEQITRRYTFNSCKLVDTESNSDFIYSSRAYELKDTFGGRTLLIVHYDPNSFPRVISSLEFYGFESGVIDMNYYPTGSVAYSAKVRFTQFCRDNVLCAAEALKELPKELEV